MTDRNEFIGSISFGEVLVDCNWLNSLSNSVTFQLAAGECMTVGVDNVFTGVLNLLFMSTKNFQINKFTLVQEFL